MSPERVLSKPINLLAISHLPTKPKAIRIAWLLHIGLIEPENVFTIKILKIWTLEKNAIVILKFERCVFLHTVMHPKDEVGMANSVDPDQNAPQSDLGLHCLPRPVCPKT